MDLQTKDKPYSKYNNKGLLRDLDEIELPLRRGYITKDDLRMKRNLNKLDVERKLRKQQAEEAKEN
jgi:hypothetical protein